MKSHIVFVFVFVGLISRFWPASSHSSSPACWGAGRTPPRPPRILLGDIPPDLAELTGYQALGTSRYGWIDISTDGDQMWVSVEKK